MLVSVAGCILISLAALTTSDYQKIMTKEVISVQGQICMPESNISLFNQDLVSMVAGQFITKLLIWNMGSLSQRLIVSYQLKMNRTENDTTDLQLLTFFIQISFS